MVLLNSLSYGFLFGLGFFASFALVLILLVLFFGRILKRTKDMELRKKLTLEMLEKYREKMSNKEEYDEAKLLTSFIEDFKLKKPMNAFFKLYKIETKIKYIDPENEDNLDEVKTKGNEDEDEENEDQKEFFGFKIQKKYFIKKR